VKIYAHRRAEETSRPLYIYDADALYGKAVQRGCQNDTPMVTRMRGHA